MTTKLPEEVLTLDFETTMKSKVGKNKASPFCEDNTAVTLAYKVPHEPVASGTQRVDLSGQLMRGRPLVGHNIKFDLHWLRKCAGSTEYLRWLKDGGTVLDTQVIEYLLSGQVYKYPKLDDLALKYTGEAKMDEVKALWDQGLDTDEINRDLVLEYNRKDVELTERVYQQQCKEVPDKLAELIPTQMDALLALQEMEWNGLHVDISKCAELQLSCQDKFDKCEEALIKIVRLAIDYDIRTEAQRDRIDKDLKIGSDKLWSALFFGTSYTMKLPQRMYTDAGETICYKSGANKGNPKYKLQEENLFVKQRSLGPRCRSIQDTYGSHRNQKGYWSVDEAVLKVISEDQTSVRHTQFAEIAKILLMYRGLAKELKTYYNGLMNLVHTDSCIHHNLNQVSTSTGRLSSTEPNGQNLPSHADSQVKDIFNSRWGDDGWIVEVDYKQLEVIMLAHLSNSSRLIQDIKEGKDLHFETGKSVMGWTTPADMTEDDRRKVKQVNFSLIYGATATGIAKTTGMDKQFVQKLIDSFYDRYPRVKTWQTENINKVNQLAKQGPVIGNTKNGYPSKRGILTTETGRRLAFDQTDAWRTGDVNVSPTKVKNYPVQAGATGDIVPLMLGKLLRSLLKHDIIGTCKMINTVHDSIIFDIHKDTLDKAIPIIQSVLESAPQAYKDTFGINFNLPLKVDVTYGKTWKQAKTPYTV